MVKSGLIVASIVIGFLALLANNGALPQSALVSLYGSYAAVVTSLLVFVILLLLIVLYAVLFSGSEPKRLSNIVG